MSAINSNWHKSSYSGATNQCVEVREYADGVDVRDSARRGGETLTFPAVEWSVFLGEVRGGQL